MWLLWLVERSMPWCLHCPDLGHKTIAGKRVLKVLSASSVSVELLHYLLWRPSPATAYCHADVYLVTQTFDTASVPLCVNSARTQEVLWYVPLCDQPVLAVPRMLPTNYLHPYPTHDIYSVTQRFDTASVPLCVNSARTQEVLWYIPLCDQPVLAVPRMLPTNYLHPYPTHDVYSVTQRFDTASVPLCVFSARTQKVLWYIPLCDQPVLAVPRMLPTNYLHPYPTHDVYSVTQRFDTASVPLCVNSARTQEVLWYIPLCDQPVLAVPRMLPTNYLHPYPTHDVYSVTQRFDTASVPLCVNSARTQKVLWYIPLCDQPILAVPRMLPTNYLHPYPTHDVYSVTQRFDTASVPLCVNSARTQEVLWYIPLCDQPVLAVSRMLPTNYLHPYPTHDVYSVTQRFDTASVPLCVNSDRTQKVLWYIPLCDQPVLAVPRMLPTNYLHPYPTHDVYSVTQRFHTASVPLCVNSARTQEVLWYIPLCDQPVLAVPSMLPTNYLHPYPTHDVYSVTQRFDTASVPLCVNSARTQEVLWYIPLCDQPVLAVSRMLPTNYLHPYPTHDVYSVTQRFDTASVPLCVNSDRTQKVLWYIPLCDQPVLAVPRMLPTNYLHPYPTHDVYSVTQRFHTASVPLCVNSARTQEVLWYIPLCDQPVLAVPSMLPTNYLHPYPTHDAITNNNHTPTVLLLTWTVFFTITPSSTPIAHAPAGYANPIPFI